jgi:Aspartyl protease
MARRFTSAALVAAALVTGCGALPASGLVAKVHVEPEVSFALPPTAAGCAGSTRLAGGAARLPITVSIRSGQVAEMANVCIGGRGPFPFIIDSGAGESIIATSLASRLHLRQSGAKSEYAGIGCTGSSHPVAVPAWSVAGVPLAAQSLTAATLPDFGGRGQPVGLLGSDVLGRFGAIRIDFTAQTMTLGGPEGAAPKGPDVVHGPRGPAPSAIVTDGQTGTTVPLTVVLTPGDAALNVALRFGHGPKRTFTVDTGSSQSVVNSSVAKSEHLAHSNLAQRQSTVCSTITTPLVHSGAWSIPGVTLHPQLIDTAPFGPISEAGLLGSDQLIRYGWVVFDYTGGRMVLG